MFEINVLDCFTKQIRISAYAPIKESEKWPSGRPDCR